MKHLASIWINVAQIVISAFLLLYLFRPIRGVTEMDLLCVIALILLCKDNK